MGATFCGSGAAFNQILEGCGGYLFHVFNFYWLGLIRFAV